MELLHLVEMLRQPVVDAIGQHCDPIVRTLALADRKLVGGTIDVFDP
jgi:hypothetical protein